MALWGKADAVYSTGTVTVDYVNETITGTGTTFTNAKVGDVISIGVGNTFGEAIISGITSDTYISIASTQFLSGDVISGVAYTVSQKPKYTLHDTNYGAEEIYGIDEYEIGAAANTEYALTHSGWVGIKTYVDTHGNLRIKHEVLVAMSGITTGTPSAAVYGDADDDTNFKDYLISISSQPISLSGISTTSDVSFTVVAASVPPTTLSYQWQYSSGVGAAYTNLVNNGIYSNVTTPTIGIGSTSVDGDRPDGAYYRVQISADAAETVTSRSVSLSYL